MGSKRDISIDQLCNLVALESKFTPATARKVMDALYKVILKQLELNKRVYLFNFGAFEIYERSSGDKRMGDLVNGGSIVRYIPPKTNIMFKPSDALENAINSDFKMPTRRKVKKKSRQQILKEDKERYKKIKPTTEELLAKALNVSQARQENDENKLKQAQR
jgi:nucleoid DNA-binding protein